MHGTGRIIFDINYTNFAWGYKNQGIIIDDQGIILKYTISTPLSPNDLTTKFRNSHIVDRIPRQLHQKLIQLAQQIRSINISSLTSIGADIGSTTGNIYMIDGSNNIVKTIKLYQRGDRGGNNDDPAAVEINSLLAPYDSLV